MQLYDITNDMSDWDKHWYAFTNVIQIHESYIRRTITSTILDKIGQESLSNIISNFCKYVKDFFKWLYEKIKAFFTKIKNFILKIIRKIRIFLFGSNTGSNSKSSIIKMCTLQRKMFAEIGIIPKFMYDINTFSKIYEDAERDLFPKFKLQSFTFDTLKTAKQHIQDVYSAVTKNLKKASDTKLTDRSDINSQQLEWFARAEMIPNRYAIIEQAYGKIESELNKFKSMTFTEENVYDIISKFSMAICADCKNVIDISFNSSDISSVKSSKEAIDNANTALICVGIISSETTKWYGIYEDLLLKVYNIYNIKGTAINIETRIPQDMINHLQDMYGGKLETGKIYITNTAISFWEQVGNNPYGLTLANVGSNVSYKNITIRVAANVFLPGDKTRELDIQQYIKSNKITVHNKEELLLSIVVHEYSHAFDDQHNRDLRKRGSTYEPPPEGMTDNYWNNDSEQRARFMQRNYIPTSLELTWARSIINELNTRFARMKNLNVIDLPDNFYN